MKHTMIKLDAPECWASLLAYGVDSDALLDEIFDCEQWLQANDLTTDDYADADFDNAYIGQFDFASTGTLQCRLVTYTFMKNGSTK